VIISKPSGQWLRSKHQKEEFAVKHSLPWEAKAKEKPMPTRRKPNIHKTNSVSLNTNLILHNRQTNKQQ
jgi:hypothetical protein